MCDEFDFLSEEENKEIEEYVLKNMSSIVEQKMQSMYIGYIDINGMKYMMKTMPDDRFEELCNKMASFVESIVSEHESYKRDMSYDLDFHMFSDNIIFTCNDLQFLIERMALLQRRLAVQFGLTIKGGIDYGKIYKYNNKFVLGSGLVSAYEIDAHYHNPVIKVANSLVDSCNTNLLKISDDEYVVDYYKIAYGISTDFVFEELPYIKSLIEENLGKELSQDAMSKYEWMKNYHNNFCKENNLDNLQI